MYDLRKKIQRTENREASRRLQKISNKIKGKRENTSQKRTIKRQINCKYRLISNIQTSKKQDDKPQPKWKEQHEDFLKIMKYNRKIKEVENNGGDVRDIKPPDASIPSDYVFCNGCSRNFAPHVADRHIPNCKKIINKPKPPSNRTQEQWAKPPEDLKQMAKTRQQDKRWSEREDSQSTMTTNTKNTIQEIEIKKKPFQKKKSSGLLTNTNSQDEVQDQQFILTSTTIGSKYKGEKKRNRIMTSEITNTDRNIMMKTTTQDMKVLPELKINKYHNTTNIAFVDCQLRAIIISNTICPFCDRKFISRAAERHIPICEKLSKQITMNIKSGMKSNSVPRAFKRIPLIPPQAVLSDILSPKLQTGFPPTQPQIKKKQSQIYQLSSKEVNDTIGMGSGLIKFCTFCGGKFQLGHKYCGGCGKKREVDSPSPLQ